MPDLLYKIFENLFAVLILEDRHSCFSNFFFISIPPFSCRKWNPGWRESSLLVFFFVLAPVSVNQSSRSRIRTSFENERPTIRTFQPSRGSSIPVLDLLIVNERDASVDVRSSKFDYSKIFSGFGDLDFAAPDEELFTEPKEGDRTSSEEAWYVLSICRL